MKLSRARQSVLVFSVVAAGAVGLVARTASAASPEAGSSGVPVAAAYQTWTSVSGLGPIRDELLFSFDVHGRFYDDMHPFNVLVRPALGYRLPLGFSVFAGYGFTPSWSADRELAEEHRAWQQLSYDAPFTAVKLSARVRVEERFRPESDAAYRLRAMVRMNVPLGLSVPLQTVLWDELFVGLNQETKWQPEVLDQNRLFCGLGWVVSPHLRVDVGYLGQVIPRKEAITVHHALSVNAGVSW